MGNAAGHEPQSLTPTEVSLLAAGTHYSEDEVVTLHRQFAADTPAGIIAFSNFQAFLASLGVLESAAVLLLFRGFDADRDGVITFAELVRGLSVMTRGTNDERLFFAFRMHDEAGTGVIPREVLITNLEALHAAFGPLHPYHAHRPTAPDGGVAEAELVDAFVKSRPTLTFEDFARLASDHPSCIRGLALTT
jgi:Ca2+-binding EF-hand superfamily protein